MFFNLLSGKDTNLISLDIKQTLASFGKKFTVLPSTTVFTFYGIAGVSVGVDIEAIISMLVDTTVGFDTQGFYVIESEAKAPSGRTVGNMLFSLNPTVTGIITGTLDIITVVPLIDVAGRVSLIGQLGLRLDDSPLGIDSDPKVRSSGLIDANLYPELKIDLGLGLTSTLFPIGNLGLPLIKKGEVEKIVPLYNKSAGSLADVKNDVKAFIDKTRGEGALKVYALGVITGDPTLLTAGTVLLGTSPQVTQAFSELATGLKESGRDMLGAAKDLALVTKTYGLKLGDTAKFLYENFAGGVTGVASALYKEVTQDIGDIAKGLYNGVTQNIGDIVKGLYNGVTDSLVEIFGALVQIPNVSSWNAINYIGQSGLNLIAKTFPAYAGFLWNRVGSVATIQALQEGGREIGGIFSDLVSGVGLSSWNAINYIGQSGLNLIAKTFPAYAGFLWNRVGSVATIQALQEGGREIGGIFSDLVSGVGLSSWNAINYIGQSGLNLIAKTFPAYAGFLWNRVGSVATIQALQEGGREIGGIFSDLVSGVGLSSWNAINYIGQSGLNLIAKTFPAYAGFLWNRVGSVATIQGSPRRRKGDRGIFSDLVSGVGLSSWNAINYIGQSGLNLIAKTFPAYAGFLWNRVGSVATIQALQEGGREIGGIFSDLVSGVGLSSWNAINYIGQSGLNLIAKTFPAYAGFLWNRVGSVATIQALQEGGREIGGIFSDLVSGVGLSSWNAINYIGQSGLNLIAKTFPAYAGFLWNRVGSVATIQALQEGGREIGGIFSDLVSGVGLSRADGIRYLLGANVLSNNFGSIRDFLLSQFNESTTLSILRDLGFNVGNTLANTAVNIGDTIADVFRW